MGVATTSATKGHASLRAGEACAWEESLSTDACQLVWSGADLDNMSIYSSGGLVCVVEGEIYRQEKYIKKFAEGFSSDQHSLAQCVVAAYRCNGPAGIQDIEGLFSAVLWDTDKQTLLLYRDASCSHYLYYIQQNDRIVFSSELECLFSVQGINKSLSKSGMSEYLAFLDISTPNTIFENVFSVEPGAVLQWQGGNITLHYDEHEADVSWSGENYQEAVSLLDTLLRASVDTRLNRHKNTGFFLSGGVDSSLLCAIAATIDRDHIDAFTVGFLDKSYDEASAAALVAKHLGIQHYPLYYSMDDYLTSFHGLARAVDQPSADPAMVPTLLAFIECASKVDTMVDGTGADTLVGIMPARHTRLATQYGSLIPRVIRARLCRLMTRYAVGRAYAPLIDFDRPQDVLMRWKGWRPDEIQRLCGFDCSLEQTRFYRIYESYPGSSHFDRYSALMGNLPDDRLHQASRHAGLPVRYPFWDRQVEDYIRSLPVPYRYEGGIQKRILKSVLERYIPKDVWHFPKHGFNFPFIDLMRHNQSALLCQYLDIDLVRRQGVFDPAQVQKMVQDFAAGNNENSFRIWGLLNFQAWYIEHMG